MSDGKRIKYADYIEALVQTENAKWVTDSFVRDRRIALYGIGVAIVQDGKRISIDPVIPCAGPLGRLVHKHPRITEFKFDRLKKKWRIAR